MKQQMPHDWSEPLVELHNASVRLNNHYNNKEYAQAEKEIKAMKINLIWLESFAKKGRINEKKSAEKRSIEYTIREEFKKVGL